MKDQILISVVMPVLNSALYIDEAICSVLKQTFTGWELIIADDGSEDNSFTIAQSRAAKDKRIKVIRHEQAKNLGVSASRNLAISEAKGNWIALLDSDDSWLPGKLEKEFQIISANPDVVLIYSKAKKISGESDNLSESRAAYGTGKNGKITDPFTILINGFITSTSQVLFKKEIFSRCGGFDETLSYGEDTLLFHQLMEHGNIYCIDEILGNHRLHKFSAASKTLYEKKIVSRFIIYEKLVLKVKKENIPHVSAAMINMGLMKIFRNYILYPHNRPDLCIIYLKRAINNSSVLLHDKFRAIIIFIKEILLSPAKTVWLTAKKRIIW